MEHLRFAIHLRVGFLVVCLGSIAVASPANAQAEVNGFALKIKDGPNPVLGDATPRSRNGSADEVTGIATRAPRRLGGAIDQPASSSDAGFVSIGQVAEATGLRR